MRNRLYLTLCIIIFPLLVRAQNAGDLSIISTEILQEDQLANDTIILNGKYSIIHNRIIECNFINNILYLAIACHTDYSNHLNLKASSRNDSLFIYNYVKKHFDEPITESPKYLEIKITIEELSKFPLQIFLDDELLEYSFSKYKEI